MLRIGRNFLVNTVLCRERNTGAWSAIPLEWRVTYPTTPQPWSGNNISDPAAFLGDTLAAHLPLDRLVQLVLALPGGGSILKQHPEAARSHGDALDAIWNAGLAAHFRNRVASLTPALVRALDIAGWTSDPLPGIRTVHLVPPALDPGLRRLVASVRTWLATTEETPIVISGPVGAGCSSVCALVAEDPRISAAFGGGILVADGRVPLLDTLRDWGTVLDLPELARVSSVSLGLARIRALASGRPGLLVLDGVDQLEVLETLRAHLGPTYRVVASTHIKVPDDAAFRVLRLTSVSAKASEHLVLGWGGRGARNVSGRSLASALRGHPALLVRAGRLVSPSLGWMTTTELLADMGHALRDSDFVEIEEAMVSSCARRAPSDVHDALIALSILPAAPISAPDDLFGSLVGRRRWAAVRDGMVQAGLVEPAGELRWQIPEVVRRVARRIAASVPGLIERSRSVALGWAVRRVAEAGPTWRDVGPIGTLAAELRVDRRLLAKLLGPDLVGVLSGLPVPFGFVAWWLPEAQVQRLAQQVVAAPTGPWTLAARQWGVDSLVREGRRSDAARVLSAVIKDARARGDIATGIDAVLQLADLHSARGLLAQGRGLLEDAIRLSARVGDHHREGRANLALGLLLDQSNEAALASETLWRAVALFRDAADPARASEATGHLGRLAQQAGQLDVAAERFRMQAALADAAQNHAGVARAETSLARLALLRGEAQDAVTWFRKVVARWDRAGVGVSPEALGSLLHGYADACFAAGLVSEGLAAAERRVQECRFQGQATDEAEALADLACRLGEIGNRAEALALLSRALARDRMLGSRRAEAQHLLAAAQIHGYQRLPGPALVCFEAARVVAEDVGWREGVAKALEGVARGEVLLGQWGPALRDAQAALTLYRRLGDTEAEARWQVMFGGILLGAGLSERGRTEMGEGARRLAALGWSADRIRGLLDGGTAVSMRA